MLKLISRLLTGAIFIFSGFLKAVDPKGSAIKIAEYLEVAGLHNSSGIAVFLAVALSSVEFILGFHLLLGLKIKRVALPTLLFMAGFTILTFFIAIFEPVTDCGCFGDAIKLTNWETLIKNLIILPFSLIVYYRRNDYTNQLSAWRQHLLTSIACFFIVGISVYSLYYLPILDFRPYHIGANIPESMIIPDDADQGEYETTFILEKDGQQKEFGVNDYPYEDSTWVFIDSRTKVIREGYQPPITALHFASPEGDDVTESIINNEQPVYLMVAPKLETASTEHINQFIEIKSMAYKHDALFYVATATLPQDCYQFDITHQAGFEYALCDETTLKTIIRSNPGLIILQKGTIIAKYNHTQLPDAAALKNPLSHSIQAIQKNSAQMLLLLYFSIITGLIIIIHKFK